MPKRSHSDVNSKKLPISCGHRPPIKNKTDRKSIHSRCSRVAYTGCKQCILKYLYTVYKKATNDYIERSKKFVCECVCFKNQLPINELFKTLKFCYSIGLLLCYEVFEFESRYTQKQMLWLLKHGAEHYCLDPIELIRKEYWDIITFIAFSTTGLEYKTFAKTKGQLSAYLPSSLISMILLFL